MEALPIIGVLGEFDALPGLSQKAQTQALNSGAAGHGCGICGAGRAALIKELIAAENSKELSGFMDWLKTQYNIWQSRYDMGLAPRL
jgi:aminobenzoyl-glutamate utilization protein B